MKFSVAVASVIAILAPTSMAQSVISIHGSGTTNPSKCYWHIMDQMQIQAKLPIRMTYRGVGSSTGQAEFIGDDTGISTNMFASGDLPISAEDFASFESGSILHLPVLLGAISFFHSVPTGGEKLNLSACLLAKILNRKVTDWTDAAVIDENPNLLNVLRNPSPITVARRVLGSSSTASITEYLHKVCPEEWPEELVGRTIEWPVDTVPCEGSGGMTDCITSMPGTIGYIDSGHGHAEGLQEIELLNAANNYISSLEASERGGILAAAENADIPTSLDADFSSVNFMNQGGTNTWPIVAMTYVYVKKDLTFIQDPAAQTLVKAFLTALYTDEYITQCEEEFGFVRVDGELREKALAEIESLTVSAGAPEWTFEFETITNEGQGDYVISNKRESYSEAEQDMMLADIAVLKAEIDLLHSEMDIVASGTGHTHDEDGNIVAIGSAYNNAMNKDSQLQAALVLSSISITLWILTIIALLVRCVTGSHTNTNLAMSETAKVDTPPETA
ncbi:phosphate ABC transporter, periplasmic phosphate-binding protein [Nitzschia inconspicua]|uniref:Phosphate ABC transporter, periplasmic phosphate-binding protein n=1 Tax=Nitzschia inconspicua TaxID=303405 RepID=A0A9K3KYV2_9STRA|nr:phosphate ABC transporter, periplasmic phosphate-binding protein [Nitzschia inconspicua]